MTPEQFIYWLNGFLEMSEAESISKKQTQIIKDHIKLVLNKKTPDYGKQNTLGFAVQSDPHRKYCEITSPITCSAPQLNYHSGLDLFTVPNLICYNEFTIRGIK